MEAELRKAAEAIETLRAEKAALVDQVTCAAPSLTVVVPVDHATPRHATPRAGPLEEKVFTGCVWPTTDGMPR